MATIWLIVVNWQVRLTPDPARMDPRISPQPRLLDLSEVKTMKWPLKWETHDATSRKLKECVPEIFRETQICECVKPWNGIVRPEEVRSFFQCFRLTQIFQRRGVLALAPQKGKEKKISDIWQTVIR